MFAFSIYFGIQNSRFVRRVSEILGGWWLVGAKFPHLDSSISLYFYCPIILLLLGTGAIWITRLFLILPTLAILHAARHPCFNWIGIAHP